MDPQVEMFAVQAAHARAPIRTRTKGSSGADKKVAVTFPICHAPAHSIFFPAASYMVE